MVHQKERESYLQEVGLTVLVVVPTVHFGVGSVLAIAAAVARLKHYGSSCVESWTMVHYICYHAGIGSMDALLPAEAWRIRVIPC